MNMAVASSLVHQKCETLIVYQMNMADASSPLSHTLNHVLQDCWSHEYVICN